MRTLRPWPLPAGLLSCEAVNDEVSGLGDWVLVHTVSQRAWGLRLRGISARTRDSALAGVAFPLMAQGRHPILSFSKLNTQPTDASCLRFDDGLTTATARRYSFPAGLFHSLLHAGLSRRPDTRRWPRSSVPQSMHGTNWASSVPHCLILPPHATLTSDAFSSTGSPRHSTPSLAGLASGRCCSTTSVSHARAGGRRYFPRLGHDV